MPGSPFSRASTVASAASSRCTNDQTAPPSPTSGNLAWRTAPPRGNLPLAHKSRLEVAAPPVEAAVPQQDPACREDGLLLVAEGGQGLGHGLRRRAVERVVLGLDRPAGPLVRPAREALGHE